MLQLILFALAKALQRLVVWLVAFPLLMIAATPFILLRAAVLTYRRRQQFRYAVADGYDFTAEIMRPLGFSSYRPEDRKTTFDAPRD